MFPSAFSVRLPWPLRPWPAMLLAAGLLLSLLLYALLPGLATTADARFYLSAAASFRTSGQLLNPDGTPYTSWGPLYPVLLALGGKSVGAWALALNVAGSLLCLGSWAYLLRRLLPDGVLAGLLTLALGLATPWLITAKFVWAEAVFQGLFGLYAVAVYCYLQQPRRGWWLLATGLGLLLCWQRTSGLLPLLGTALGLLLAYPEAVRTQLRAWLLHALILAAGLGGWLLYATRAAAVPELYRSRGWQGLRETLGDYGYVLLRWLGPVQQEGWPKHWAFEVVLPLLLLALVAAAWRSPVRYVRLLGAVVVSYFVCLIGITIMSRAGGNVYDGERYAAVVYGPALLLLGAGLSRLPLPRRWLHLGLALWLLYPAARAVKVAQFCRQRTVAPVEMPVAPRAAH